MQLKLELLAPAKNRDIGIAAITCGADAVYIAGPSFGAREAAGNSLSEIAELVEFAYKFGAKVYMTINTIVYDNELRALQNQIDEAYKIGIDAFIVQDLGVLKLNLPPIPLFASTQTNIRTPEQARMLESLGFERLILARELSLEQISEIGSAVKCDIESFVHGALCVSYSGQCYLSERLTGRSANRGRCIQACRSKYDLIDSSGKVLVKNHSILSLKDLKLDEHIGKLIEAGVSSFKIEGRLKNISYIKNVVRHYRGIIDKYIATHPQYSKASFGAIEGGFKPNINATFNRGYTSLFIEGKRGDWNSQDSAKSLGEYLGEISSIKGNSIAIKSKKELRNGDGLAFIGNKGEVSGSRIERYMNGWIELKQCDNLSVGMKVYRNLNQEFERELASNMPERVLRVKLAIRCKAGKMVITASCENGKSYTMEIEQGEVANNQERALESIKAQLQKRSGIYTFSIENFDYDDKLCFYPISQLNSIRREIANNLDSIEVNSPTDSSQKIARGVIDYNSEIASKRELSYLANCSNNLSQEVYKELGINTIAPAYELKPVVDAELMRTKYCIKYQMGYCPKQHPNRGLHEPLYLLNNGYKLRLKFDCKNCEMVVIL